MVMKMVEFQAHGRMDAIAGKIQLFASMLHSILAQLAHHLPITAYIALQIVQNLGPQLFQAGCALWFGHGKNVINPAIQIAAAAALNGPLVDLFSGWRPAPKGNRTKEFC